MISALKTIALLALPMMAAAQNVEFLHGDCVAFIETTEAEGETEKLVCEAENGIMYVVPQVNTAWIEEKRTSGELVSGQTLLDLPANTMVDMDTWSLVLSGPPGLKN